MHVWQTHCCRKWFCQTLSDFLKIKKWSDQILIFFRLSNVFLGVGMPHGCTGAFPATEGGIQVLAGSAPSSQTVGSLLITSGKLCRLEKFGKKRIRWIYFNVKIQSTTLVKTQLLKL